MEDPCDVSIIEFIMFKTGIQVNPMLAPVQQLHKMIRKYYYDENDEHADDLYGTEQAVA